LSALLSNPDKVFWPDEGHTKLNLAEYYSAIFPEFLPSIKDRMLALERCPDGMLGNCFFQKQTPRSVPIGTPTQRLEHVGHGAGVQDPPSDRSCCAATRN
jgi:DNA primase